MNNSKQVKNWSFHPVSLRKWKLSGFKSVKNQVEIELAPLTILVGENSAGKSTLIQSILFMAQNSISDIRGGKNQNRGLLDLNGSLVALGDMKETLCDLGGSPARKFEIGANWHFRERTGRGRFTSNQIRRDQVSLSPSNENEMSLDFSTNFEPAEGNTGSSLAVIGESKIDFFIEGSGAARFTTEHFENDLLSDEIMNRFPDNYSVKHQTHFGIHPEFANTKEIFTKNNRTTLTIEEHVCLATQFMGGLPITGLKKRKAIDYLLEVQRELYIDGMQNETSSLLENNLRIQTGSSNMQNEVNENNQSSKYENMEIAKRAILENIALSLEKLARLENAMSKNSTPPEGMSFEDFDFLERQFVIPLDRIPWKLSKADAITGKLTPFTQSEFGRFWDEIEEIARTQNKNKLAAEHDILCFLNGRRMSPMRSHLGSMSRNAVDRWNRYLSNKVLYLGPLRELPKAAYGLESTIENPNIPLGLRGEFWARRIHQDTRKKRYPRIINGEIAFWRASLEEAVSYWLGFVEGLPEDNISSQIKVTSPSWYGYAPKIGSRTPSAIGVGVTQVLPVIELCLMAAPGDLILLEQPELHLNPGMQQRLAEFLLIMVKNGRQIIVETHSEYLITRLRRLAVTESSNKDLYSILFAERDEAFGTNYRTVNVNSLGELSEWPTGFFDQVTDDLRILLGASNADQE